MRYYKVVKVQSFCGGHERLMSLFASGKAAVEYEVGKLTTPPDWLKENGIIVFDNLKDAESVASISSSRRVYEVAVMGPPRELPAFYDLTSLSEGKPRKSTGKFASGSVAFDGVILMREVSKDGSKFPF